MDKKIYPPNQCTQKWTLEAAIKQLEYCEYEAIGGSLVWNDAFIWLKNTHTDEINQLRAELAEKDKEIERLTDAMSFSESKALDRSAELKVALKQIKSTYYDACQKCIFENVMSCPADPFQRIFPCKDNKGNYYYWAKAKAVSP